MRVLVSVQDVNRLKKGEAPRQLRIYRPDELEHAFGGCPEGHVAVVSIKIVGPFSENDEMEVVNPPRRKIFPEGNAGSEG